MHNLSPELNQNYCRIAPEWEKATGQRLWFIAAPYGGAVLRFGGEPTSLLYAIAPLIDEVKKGSIPGLSMDKVALLRPVVSSEAFYVDLEYKLKRQSLRAVCISNLTAGNKEAKRIARLVKKVDPNIVTIFGGPHEDDIEEKTAVDPLYDKVVDFSVAGDGEYALLYLARIIFENPKANIGELKSLVLECAEEFKLCEGRGGVYFKHGQQARQVSLSGRLPILDALPLMPRELLHEADARTFTIFRRAGRNVKTAQIMTHRGCAWRCSFCSESSSINFRSVDSVIREIEHIRNFNEHASGYERENYEAIFFDDSTFTTRSARRKNFLKDLFAYLRLTGLEWGCQTRLDQIDEEILQEMKEAGCTYIFTGLESASEEMLRAMIKDEGRKHIEKAFNAINKVGMRMGVSLVFGVAEPGTDRTRETERTINETLDLIGQQTRQGNIALVSLNLATYYPDTRMTASHRSLIDFNQPIVHTGYPWNRFEEGEGHHPLGVTERMAKFIIEESVKRFGEYLVDQDIHSVGDYMEAYRAGALGGRCVDLNHASLTRPLPEAEAVALSIARHRGSSREKLRDCDEARAWAASLMGVCEDRSDHIAIARNTTEAASLGLWLTKLYQTSGPVNVVTTNAENLSIPRALRFFMDHGNPVGRDLWSSYQDFGVQKRKDYFVSKVRTPLQVTEVDVVSGGGSLEETILRHVNADTRLVVFCHVIRDDGRICDVKGLCAAIRRINPDAYILIDGAQALGALPSVDVEDLGCDLYVASPHKTLGSYPLGLLYMNDRAMENITSLPAPPPFGGPPLGVVMDGMFARSLNVTPTVEADFSLPEVAGFTAAVDSLTKECLINGNDCGRLDEKRQELKTLLYDKLRRLRNVEVCSPIDRYHTNFILSFRIKDEDNRYVVERLWRDHLVFLSYIARTNLIRASFGPLTEPAHVLQAVNGLESVLQDIRASAPRQPVHHVLD